MLWHPNICATIHTPIKIMGHFHHQCCQQMGSAMDEYQQANKGASANVYKKSDAQKANKTTVQFSPLNHKQLETHGCVPSTVATDALVLQYPQCWLILTDLYFPLYKERNHKKENISRSTIQRVLAHKQYSCIKHWTLNKNKNIQKKIY